MPRGLHNPLPASLRSECKKASQILESFLEAPHFGNPGKELPEKVLANAKGLAICTVAKAGMLGSARFGSGLVIARLDNGSWSAPSAISLAGVGFGGQWGFELTDFVFILDDAGLRSFLRMGSLTLGANISIAFGPVGRNAEFTTSANADGVAKMFAYSKTKGLFGGVSIEGGMMVERRSANKKLYKCKVTASQLFSGEVPPPPEAERLLQLLQSDRFQRRAAIPPSEPTSQTLEPAPQAQALTTEPENQPPESSPEGVPPTPQAHELPTGPENPVPVEPSPKSVQPTPDHSPAPQTQELSKGPEDHQSSEEPSPEAVQPTPDHSPAEWHEEPTVSRPAAPPAETTINIPSEPTTTAVNAEEDRPQTRILTPDRVEVEPHGTSTPEKTPLEARAEPKTDTPGESNSVPAVEPRVPAPTQAV
ncbi:hypothetical protein BDV26DRAFT_261924 [Aspergillus bertholletiae]|uniref:Ysc84 actin-binding domain-containing protein n=1 Tax=Aspergillus bertholletiae TaxID=1226010 RepID=A0A5N7B9A1_9EURO|nr:hypothetical protein BDV26DRAFT_261924 [Aspergillus bertholletiae]